MSLGERTRFEGALRVARLSLHVYVLAAAAIAAGAAIALWPGVPPPLRVAAVAGVLVAAWFSAASFLAFHWIFDRSGLTRWTWLAGELPAPPSRWVQVSGGLRETHAPLDAIFPGAEGLDLDIYDPKTMPAPAITRARSLEGSAAATAAESGALPVEDAWADAVVVVLAAHEIREADRRERFFRELARILAPDGTLVLIEHPRNVAAALAFGPLGLSHFLPSSEWERLSTLARLTPRRTRTMSPFVTITSYTHAIR